MEVFRQLSDISPDTLEYESVVTVGSFDGVHRGHCEILRFCIEMANASGRHALVITFNQHPLAFLNPQQAPLLLTSAERKIELLGGIGLDAVACLPFDREMAMMDAEVFVRQVLFERCKAGAVVCGYDFAFGRRAKGTPATIRDMGLHSGVEVITPSPLVQNGAAVSSTRIRQSLVEGRIQEVTDMLGRYYDLDGIVVAGRQLGRTLDFPTANLLVNVGICVPSNGVYAVLARTGDLQWRPGMIYIGSAPTFGVGERRLEVNLFDFEGDLYGTSMRVQFIQRIREERRFESTEALVAQLQVDRQNVLAALKSLNT